MGCQGQSGFDRLDCDLQAMSAPPLCSSGSISPRLQGLVLHKLKALRSRLERAHQRGGKGLNRVATRMDGVLSSLQQVIARALKHHRIDASCQAALNQQLAALRGEAAALRQ